MTTDFSGKWNYRIVSTKGLQDMGRVTNLVSLVDQLVSTCNGFQTIYMVELSRDRDTKEPTSTSWTNCPGIDIFGIAPYQVAEGSLVGNFLRTGYNPDLVDCPDLRAQASVYAEHRAINDSRKNQEVKDLTASLPDGGITVFLLTFLVEAVDLSDLSRLVVTTNKDNPVGVSGPA